MSRVFVGIPLSPALQEAVSRWKDSHRRFPVRWLAPKNLHVTLVPPWEETNIPLALRDLSALAGKITPFSIRFTRIALGPSPGGPELIWAEGISPSEIVTLAKLAHDALGIPAPGRPFKLHATLARFNADDFRKFPVRKLNEPVAWEMLVDRVVLFESHLGPRGADYQILGAVRVSTTR